MAILGRVDLRVNSSAEGKVCQGGIERLRARSRQNSSDAPRDGAARLSREIRSQAKAEDFWCLSGLETPGSTPVDTEGLDES